MPNSARAQELKKEGNAFFAEGEWGAAYDKYAEAIQLDGQNAILYANRAACAIHLKKFVEAKTDAHKATILDPKYAKAWGRLASACTGLLEYKESAEYWRKALATFPSEGLTATEQKQKLNCELELKTALQRATLSDEEKLIVMPPHVKGEMPWYRAKALEARLQAGLPDIATSSAWVILRAAKLWDAGVEEMKNTKESITLQGIVFSGCLGVIQKLTDAILTDARIFRIEDALWLPMYNRQISYEGWKSGAWPSLPPQAVKEEALKRQQEGGWEAVRPAIDITVRAWIMQAFIINRPTGTGNGNPSVAVIKYDAVLELLDWGRTGPWKDIPTPDKGVVFEDYFVRAVRQLRLDAFGNVVGRPESNNGPEDVWKRMYDDAQSLVDEMPVVGLAALPPGDYEPGFVTAYGIYPKAAALSMIGLYHHHVGWLIGQQRKAGDDTAAQNIARAHFSYINATKLIPPDDEKYAWFLTVAVQMVQMSGAPFEVVLGYTGQLRESLPIMKKIWEYSAMSMQGSHIAHSMILRLEDRIKKDIAEGKIKRSDFMAESYSHMPVNPRPES